MKGKKEFAARFLTWTIFIALAVAATEFVSTTCTGAVEGGRIAAVDSIRRGLTDPRELEAFVDGVIGAQMEAYGLVGAAAAAVKDGSLFFSKGYGYADLEMRKKVVPDSTLFRTGSVGKLLTWTAVMQLVEQKRLDLNVDVNEYLKSFQIPDTYPEPVTLFHLLTHTAGFETSEIGFFARNAGEMMPLGECLAEGIPTRVRPPGRLTAYSNYGTALAGYIVELVSGMRFERYVEERILKPLGMLRSTFRQPPPVDLATNMAVGYRYGDGAFRAEEFELVPMSPAGSMSATVVDMAKFMIAHLQNGRCGEVRILRDSTAREMHRRQSTNDSRVSGMTLGFMEMDWNGERIISHGGDTYLFHAVMILLPKRNEGFYVCYNSVDGGEAWGEMLSAFLEHYYAAPMPPVVRTSENFTRWAGRYTGNYLAAGDVHSTPEKLLNLFRATITVEATHDGFLRVGGVNEPSLWVEVEPLVFRNLYRDEYVFFREDSGRGITHMFFENKPVAAMIKLPWYEAPSFHFGLLVACMILFLSAVVTWPAGLAVAVGRRENRPVRAGRARFLAWCLSALNIFFLAVFGRLMMSPSTVYGVPAMAKVVLIIPLLTTVMTAGLIGYTVLAWRRRYWGDIGRIHYTLVTLASLAFIWFLHYWNLLGNRF